MKRSASTLLLAVSLLAPGFARAGGDGDVMPVRKQFRQSATYPYIFQADCYLATTGPAPLRFGPRAPACAQRVAPPLLAAAQGHPKPPPAPPLPAPAPEITTTQTQNPPAYPAPANTAVAAAPEAAAGSTGEGVDFSRPPEEVLEFFRTTDGKAGKRIYLFDPIFQPAKPHDAGTSKATYTQKP